MPSYQLYNCSSPRTEVSVEESRFRQFCDANKRSEAIYQSLSDDVRTLKADVQSAFDLLKQKFGYFQNGSSARYDSTYSNAEMNIESDVQKVNCVIDVDMDNMLVDSCHFDVDEVGLVVETLEQNIDVEVFDEMHKWSGSVTVNKEELAELQSDAHDVTCLSVVHMDDMHNAR